MTAARGDRLARLLALVPWLLRHPGVTIEQAAEHFAVTPEQLEKDLWLVVCCGLPGHGPDQLIDIQFWDDEGRIDVIDPQALVAPAHLTLDEAVSLQVGLSVLAGVARDEDRDSIRQTMELLAQATGMEPESEAHEEPSEPLLTDVGADDRIRTVLHSALEEGRAVRIEYYTATRDVVSRRDIRPHRIVVGSGRVFVEAWCAQAKDARTFRLDRILDAQIVDDIVEGSASTVPPLRSVLSAATEVIVQVAPAARWILEAYDMDVLDEPGDSPIRARMEVWDPRWLVRLVLGLRGDAIVLEPPEYRAMVAEAAKRALDAYTGDSTGE